VVLIPNFSIGFTEEMQSSQSAETLRETLHRINGKGYKAYRDIEGRYDFGVFHLIVDHVQADPFAAPSRVRVVVDIKKAGIPEEALVTKARRVALRDYLARVFDRKLRAVVKGRRGIGTSGMISIDRGGQEVLNRTAVVVKEGRLEARFVVGLPAAGRTVLGEEAVDIFLREIPQVVQGSLFAKSLSLAEMGDPTGGSGISLCKVPLACGDDGPYRDDPGSGGSARPARGSESGGFCRRWVDSAEGKWRR
jgi:hypothetical protein